MLIDLYVLHYNEERIVKIVTEYWKYLPLRKIFVIDNLSTDSSLPYIRANFPNVEVLVNPEKDMNDVVHMMIKREVWKRSRGLADFVIVSDFDEVVYDPNILGELQYMKDNGYTVADLISLTAICRDEDWPQTGLMHESPGMRFYRDPRYDKKILFDPNKIEEMKYSPGAHAVEIVGDAKLYRTSINLFHIQDLGLKFLIDKHRRLGHRQSETNRANGFCNHYATADEEKAREFEHHYAESRTYREWYSLLFGNRKGGHGVSAFPSLTVKSDNFYRKTADSLVSPEPRACDEKVTILQYATKDYADLPYIRISRKLCEMYAARYSLDYVFKLTECASWFESVLNKLNVISETLADIPEDSYLAYIDTDAFIARPEFDLRKFLDDEHEIFIACDIGKNSAVEPFFLAMEAIKQLGGRAPLFQVLQTKFPNYNDRRLIGNLFISMMNPWGLNSGFMILKKTSAIIQFINSCIAYGRIDYRFKGTEPSRATGEQDIISYFLQSPDYIGKLKILPPRTQGHLVFNSDSEFGYKAGETFLLHMYGHQTKEVRNNAAQMIFDSDGWRGMREVSR